MDAEDTLSKDWRMRNAILISLILLSFSVSCSGQKISKGHFNGTLILKPTADGRNMTIVETFSYTDWEGHTLTVSPGFVSDGASIPRAAWSLIGGPWDGKYRQAAVVHDVGCVSHKYTWEITDRLFYEAMLDSDVSKPVALTMYYAVLVGGPRWKLIAIKTASSPTALDKAVTDFIQANNEEGGLTSLLGEEKIEVIKEPSGERDSQYQAMVYEVIPAADFVTTDELKKLLSNAQAREKSSNPMTPSDIDTLVKQREKIRTRFVMQEPEAPSKPS